MLIPLQAPQWRAGRIFQQCQQGSRANAKAIFELSLNEKSVNEHSSSFR
jgi:hypothetical protein